MRSEPGARRIGEYTVERELGRGGMGVVYAAHHPRFGEVALKLLLGHELGVDPEALARLRREAVALQTLRHRGVVPVHEVGEHAGLPFVAMALVRGESLHGRLRRGPLDAASAAAVTRDLAAALAHLHAHGVIHRDLKPHNVLLTEGTDAAVLVDFGLARVSFERERLTLTGMVLGTPAYMPPEQALGGAPPTPALDVYALGATLYEMLCGRPPFEGSSALGILSRVLEGPPPPRPSQVRPGVDPELERLCLRCMDRDPARRPGAGAVARTLARWRPPRQGRRWRSIAALGGVAVGAVVLGAVAVGAVALGAGALGAGGADTPGLGAADPDAPLLATTSTSTQRPEQATSAGNEASDDQAPQEGERQALALLRRLIEPATQGRAAAAAALSEAELAAEMAPRSARVRLACAWIARTAARAGVADPAEPLLVRAEEHLAVAARAGIRARVVQALRQGLADDRQELAALARQQAAASTPADRYDLAVRLRRFGRREEAIALLTALSGDPDSRGALFIWRVGFAAGELWLSDRCDEARAAYEEVLRTAVAACEQDPDQVAAWRFRLWCHLRLAELHQRQRDFDQALRHVRSALLLPRAVFGEGDVGRLHVQRALALTRGAHPAEGLAPARDALDAFAADGLANADLLAVPTAALGAALAATGDADGARAALERALTLAEQTTLDAHRVRSMTHELALQAFPGDPATIARAEEVFP